MNWDALFSAVNAIALVAWAGLIFLPRWPALLAACLYSGVGLLCLIYSVALAAVVTGILDPSALASAAELDFTTIDGVRSIFAGDSGATIGWTHYLALDLFAGIWIARDADQKKFSRLAQAPILLATFLAGPVGLLLWLILRERRARKSGRWH